MPQDIFTVEYNKEEYIQSLSIVRLPSNGDFAPDKFVYNQPLLN